MKKFENENQINCPPRSNLMNKGIAKLKCRHYVLKAIIQEPEDFSAERYARSTCPFRDKTCPYMSSVNGRLEAEEIIKVDGPPIMYKDWLEELLKDDLHEANVQKHVFSDSDYVKGADYSRETVQTVMKEEMICAVKGPLVKKLRTKIQGTSWIHPVEENGVIKYRCAHCGMEFRAAAVKQMDALIAHYEAGEYYKAEKLAEKMGGIRTVFWDNGNETSALEEPEVICGPFRTGWEKEGSGDLAKQRNIRGVKISDFLNWGGVRIKELMNLRIAYADHEYYCDGQRVESDVPGDEWYEL